MSKYRATSAAARELQAKNAAAARWNTPDRADIARDYAAQRISDYVEKVVADSPPLTDSQRERIAALLRVGREPRPLRSRDEDEVRAAVERREDGALDGQPAGDAA